MNSLFYFDSHAHLTGDGVFEDIEAILNRAELAGVRTICNICTDRTTLERGLRLSEQYPWIYTVAATTPHDVEKWGEADFDWIAQWARQGKLQAVGETGLDYYYEHAERSVQQRFLRRYLQLALECRLPVVIHCREAFSDLFTILEEEYRIGQQYAPGVLHCFTGTMAEAEKVLELGWMLSLSGIVTFKKSQILQEVARKAPLSQLLIETDTPYLAPQNQRGKRNEPAFLIETAAFIAALKHLPLEEVVTATTHNAKQLFRIK